MEFSKSDQIEFLENKVIHQSAGGFVFYETPDTHILYVALLKKPDGKFYIPKGHILKNEKPNSAAIREVREELRLDKIPKIITKIGLDSYTFTLPVDERVHYKNVHLYVFNLSCKESIKPLESEDFIKAAWLPFNIALEKISFDRENLLRARQIFYYNKRVKIYQNLFDISSITIAIPTYNGARTLKRTLDSIIESLKEVPSPIKKEILVCTDHCADNTKTLVENFIDKKKTEKINIKLIDNDGPQGKTIVLNKIFNNSSGELFCVIDDDVILENRCLMRLLETLVANPDLRCVFSVWKRLPFRSKNPWKLFWYWILGIKFDIQPYDKQSEIMRGACMMFRRKNFVQLPPVLVFNEDQFIQYIYWPKTKGVQNSIIYFSSVSDIFDYYKRFIRIMAGSKQMLKYITKERIEECNKSLFRSIDYHKIMSLPWKQKAPFLFYRFVRFFINAYVKIKLHFIEEYEWFRIKQN